jgi:twitching motility protein PilT
MMYHKGSMTLEEILRLAVQKGASDIHLKAGVTPVVRQHGVLRALSAKEPPLSSEEIEAMARQVMNEKQWAYFLEHHEIDFGYGIAGVARFRFNAFRQRGTVRIVVRNVPHVIPTFADLSLPKQMSKLAQLERGLVLVTGAAGTGKSSTIASLINEINQNVNKHILTIEDPIEFLIRDKKSLITQREVGVDTADFMRALRAGLRQDPDVIFIGEMRDRETMEIALIAAETGHLVFSTLHTLDAPETINRILSTFESARHAQLRLQMGSTVRAIISQRLCRRKDGSGFVPAVEILVNNARVREMIEDPQKTSMLHDAIEEGQTAWGMQSFDQSLMELLDQGTITMDEALLHCSKPEDFRIRVGGITAMDGKKWSSKGDLKKDNKEWATEVELQLTNAGIKKKKAT